jgi:hypothetical protein
LATSCNRRITSELDRGGARSAPNREAPIAAAHTGHVDRHATRSHRTQISRLVRATTGPALRVSCMRCPSVRVFEGPARARYATRSLRFGMAPLACKASISPALKPS